MLHFSWGKQLAVEQHMDLGLEEGRIEAEEEDKLALPPLEYMK